MPERKRKLFCEINPACYAIAVEKEILLRHLRDLAARPPFAITHAPGHMFITDIKNTALKL